MPIIFRARICTRHSTRQLGILLGIGMLLGIKLGNQHFYQVTDKHLLKLQARTITVLTMDYAILVFRCPKWANSNSLWLWAIMSTDIDIKRIREDTLSIL